MSKKIQFPNGYVGTVSDAVAEKLKNRPDHKIVGTAEKPALPKIEKKGE